MKTAIHPQYFEDATINCACGAVYKTGSTKQTISVELCAACHPFYTGTQNIIDTARRVEKFQERVTKRASAAEGKVGKAAKKIARAEKRKAAGPKMEYEETKTGRVARIAKKESKKAEK